MFLPHVMSPPFTRHCNPVRLFCFQILRLSVRIPVRLFCSPILRSFILIRTRPQNHHARLRFSGSVRHSFILHPTSRIPHHVQQRNTFESSQIPGPPFKPAFLERLKYLGLYALKLPSADTAVVRRTLTSLTQNPQGLEGADEAKEHRERRREFWAGVKPAHFSVKFGSVSLRQIVQFMIMGLLIGLLGAFAFGRRLLFKFPDLFSLGLFRKTGPTEEEVSSATFKMWFVGRGYKDAGSSPAPAMPDTEIITRVSGPEIGYAATPIILIQCAIILLSQRRNLPNGVYPPGIVFGHTNLQERLQANGIRFDFISKRSLQQTNH